MNHQAVDSMMVLLSFALLSTVLSAQLTKEPYPLTGVALWVFLGIAVAAFAVSFGIGYRIAYGVGPVAAIALWLGAGLAFGISWLLGVPVAARWIALAVGALALPPLATYYVLKRGKPL